MGEEGRRRPGRSFIPGSCCRILRRRVRRLLGPGFEHLVLPVEALLVDAQGALEETGQEAATGPSRRDAGPTR